jgi:hypothetical protein
VSTTSKLNLHILVYRRLDNRQENMSDDSPRALQLHQRRREALHEALDGVEGWSVADWGATNDVRPHELVEIILSVAANPLLHTAAVSAATWVGLEAVKASLGALVSEAVKALLTRLIPKQREEKILDFMITLPNGVQVRCDPSGSVTIVAGPQP